MRHARRDYAAEAACRYVAAGIGSDSTAVERAAVPYIGVPDDIESGSATPAADRAPSPPLDVGRGSRAHGTRTRQARCPRVGSPCIECDAPSCCKRFHQSHPHTARFAACCHPKSAVLISLPGSMLPIAPVEDGATVGRISSKPRVRALLQGIRNSNKSGSRALSHLGHRRVTGCSTNAVGRQ